VFLGSGEGPYEIYWSTPGTKTITLTVTENGAVSEESTQFVTVKSESVAPTAANVTLSVICDGESTELSVVGGLLGTGAEWYWSESGCGGPTIETGSSITVEPSTSTNYYVWADGDCNTTSCASVSVTVKSLSVAADSISSPVNALCLGESVTLSVEGGLIGTGADWQWFTGSCIGVAIGDGSSIEVTPTTTTTYYVKAIGDCNTTSCVSKTITVKSGSVAASSIVASETSICPSDEVTLTVSGGSLGFDADWVWYTENCGLGSAIGTGISIQVYPTEYTTYYVRAEGECDTTGCKFVSVAVNAPPSITQSPVDLDLCENGTANFQVIASGTGVSYQWFEYMGGSWSPLADGTFGGVTYSGSNGTNLVILDISTSLNNNLYHCIVSGTCAPQAFTDTAKLEVNGHLVINNYLPFEQRCVEENVQFWISVTGGDITYQWQVNQNEGSGWQNLSNNATYSGVNSDTIDVFDVSEEMSGYLYRCIVDDDCSDPTNSEAAMLDVIAPHEILVQPQDVQACNGSEALIPLTNSGNVSSYQWQENMGSGWVDLNDGYNASSMLMYDNVFTNQLSIPNMYFAYEGLQYRCILSGTCAPNDTSVVVEVSLYDLEILTDPETVTIGEGGSTFFFVEAIGYNITYEWWVSINGGFSYTLEGSTDDTLEINNAQASYDGNYYYCKVIDDCGLYASSDTVRLWVNSAPAITRQPDPAEICEEGNTIFDINALGTITGYQWQGPEIIQRYML